MFLWNFVSTFFFYFFYCCFLFAHFVAVHLKECNTTRKGKEGTCLRLMMAKEKWAAGSLVLTQEWPFLGSSGCNWLSNFSLPEHGFFLSDFPQVFFFPLNLTLLLSSVKRSHFTLLFFVGVRLPLFALRSTAFSLQAKQHSGYSRPTV